MIWIVSLFICSQRVFARTHWNNSEARPSTNHSRSESDLLQNRGIGIHSAAACSGLLSCSFTVRYVMDEMDEACMPKLNFCEFPCDQLDTVRYSSLSKWDDCEFQVSQSWRVKAPKKAPLFPFFGCACRCCCCCCCCLGCCGWAYCCCCCCMYCCGCCFCPFLPFPLPSSFPLPHALSPSARSNLCFSILSSQREGFLLGRAGAFNFHKQSWQSSIHFCPIFLIQIWIPSPHLRIYNNLQYQPSILLHRNSFSPSIPKFTKWVNM